MKAVANTLGVARSNLVEAAQGRHSPRQPYRKAGDAELLSALRRLVDERPTYGYRRLAALLNRERRTRGEPAVNGKRVLRILRAAGLTLQARTARRPGRTHARRCRRRTPLECPLVLRPLRDRRPRRQHRPPAVRHRRL